MNPLRAAMESIAFQDKGFANSLTKYFQSILDNYKSGEDAQNSEERDQIVKLTFERTGLRIKLNLDSSVLFTIPPTINNGHIFSHSWFRETASNDENVLLKRLKEFKQTSYVDLKNARVGGFFSEIESTIVVGYDTSKIYKLNAGEMTAFYLHELGHVFTTYEYISNTITTNFALATTIRSLNKGDSKKHEYVVKELGKVVSGDERMFAELEGVTDKTVTTALIIGNTQDWYRSESGVSNYDETTCEAVADAFAARFGLAREVVSVVAKIHKATGDAPYYGFTRVIFAMNQCAAMVLLPLVIGILGLPLIAVAIGIINAIALYVSGDGHRDFTYDDLKVRFMRVKEQSMEMLKNKHISKTDKQYQLQAIASIEKQIAEIKGGDGNVIRAVSNFVFPSNRKAKKAIELQRELEQLSANDIFAKAAELSVMA